MCIYVYRLKEVTFTQTSKSLSEADGPVDDVEEEEEHRKSSDQDVVVIRQLMAVPIFTSMAALLGQVISL